MKKFTSLFVFAIVASLIIGSTAFGQITQVSSPQTTTTSSATLTIDKPSGVVTGDIMFAQIIQTDNDGGSLSLPVAAAGGWTLITDQQLASSGNDEWRGTLFYRIATAADGSVTDYTFNLSAAANDGNIGAIVAFHGVDNTTPFDAPLGTFNIISSDDLSASSITTVTANAAIVMFGMNADDESYSNWQTATGPLSLSNESYDQTSSSGPDKSIGAAWAIKAVAGSTGTGTAEISGTDNESNGALLIALRPAPVVPANLWASASSGTQIADYTVSAGLLVAGPTNRFAPTFPGTTTGGSSTAAIGRTALPSAANGYFYWLPNTSGNSGVVEVFGSDANGASQTRIGSLDVNGGSGNSLGFVRLGMGPDGTGWILAGDGTTLYLAKFSPNGVNPVSITLEDADGVNVSGGSVATFQNGDICLNGNGTLFALANNGSGVTQIFTGAPAGNGTTLTKKWDLVDPSNNPFSGTVNGVAFDVAGSLYITTGSGLYYINAATVNGPAGTVQCSLVQTQSGLQDLASNVFPANSPLPVKFIDFTVNKSGNNAILNWSTATEVNNDHFAIERSSDGINFNSVGIVNGNGTTSTVSNYQFTDPLSSVSDKILYYRLKQVDADNKAIYSKIVALRLNGSIVKNFTVYPNPFAGDIKVQISSSKESTAIVRITNAAGQQVANRKANLQVGENIIILQNLETLSPGMHILEIITEDGKSTQKIMKK